MKWGTTDERGVLIDRLWTVDWAPDPRLARVIDWEKDDWLFSRGAALSFAAREARRTGAPRYVNGYRLAANRKAYVHDGKVWAVFLGGLHG
jgi:hypothetical protein